MHNGNDDTEELLEWVRKRKAKDDQWTGQINRMVWAIATTLATGFAVSLVGLLWWAFGVFVERGGK